MKKKNQPTVNTIVSCFACVGHEYTLENLHSMKHALLTGKVKCSFGQVVAAEIKNDQELWVKVQLELPKT